MAEAKVACPNCGKEYTKSGMGRHLLSCLRSGEGTLLVIEARGSKAYWLFLVASPEATLQELDALLRDTWLECCGHMSQFEIEGTRYVSQVFDEGGFGFGPPQQPMTATIASVLPPGSRFGYEYDFGSTTELTGRVVGRVAARPGEGVALLARNAPLSWTCDTCGKKPSGICPGCGQVSCKRCEENPCDCEERWADPMPIVNSPRMGVCGYVG
jgi:hypothetical protein